MKKILIFPQRDVVSNLYLPNLVKTIAGEYEVVGVDFALKHKKRFFFMYDVCHLNWLENIKGNSEFWCFCSFVVRIVFLFFLKIFHKPIVWTVHNKMAHNQTIGKKYSKILIHLLLKWSTRIHILCKETLEDVPALKLFADKVVMIPHGDYIGNFGEGKVDLYKKYGIPQDKLIILFTGKIGPYKNIELLVKAFERSQNLDSRFVLLICGKCSDVKYYSRLLSLVHQDAKNIYFDFNFIPNDCLGDYLNQSAILVTPYSKDSALNSGTLWMAFSYGKTIICPRLGCVKDIANVEKFAYIYDYENDIEHLGHLIESFNQMMQDVFLNVNVLAEKGKQALITMQGRTWKKNASLWIHLYDF